MSKSIELLTEEDQFFLLRRFRLTKWGGVFSLNWPDNFTVIRPLYFGDGLQERLQVQEVLIKIETTKFLIIIVFIYKSSHYVQNKS